MSAPDPSAATPSPAGAPNGRRGGLLRSTAVFSAMTLLSRIAGFLRDALQSRVFGVSVAMDAFVIAYRIPNYLRRIFAEGSVQMAFVPVFNELRERGDPKALKELQRFYGTRDDLTLCDSAAEALEDCDALAVLTEWREFRSPDLALMRERISDRVMFDGRNIYDPAEIEDAGIAYYGVGRGRSLMP